MRLSPVDSFPRARGVAFTIGDTAYLGCGANVPGTANCTDIHGYTQVGNTWTTEPAYTGAGGNIPFAFVINDTAYVGGGGNVSCVNDFNRYTPSTGHWQSETSFPINLSFVAGFAIGHKGYAGTGGGSCGATANFYEYDPYNGAGGTWRTLTPFPDARGACVGFSAAGKGYIGLGSNNGSSLNTIYEFDPAGNAGMGSWRQMASLPLAAGMRETSHFVLCGKLIVTGGDTSVTTSNGMSNQTWMFDPSDGLTGKWTRLPDFPGTPVYSPQGFAIGDTGYFMGGVAYNNNFSSQLWQYVSSLLYVSPDTAICAGTSAVLSANGGSVYKWSPTVGLSDSVTYSSSIPVGIKQVTASPSVTTTYTITEAVCGQTATVVVTVNNLSAYTVSANPPNICSGQTSTLTVTGNANYTWSPSAGLNNDTTGNTVMASPAVTTTYTVASGSGSCAFSDTVVVTVGNTAVGGMVSAVRDTICQGTPGNLSLSGNSSGNIQWQSSVNDTNFTNAVNDTLANYKTTPLMQTTWYRAQVGSGNCSAISDTLKLFVPPALTAYFNVTQTGANQLTFNSDSSSGNIRSYHWDFGDGQTSNDSNPSHTYTKDTTYYICLTLYDGSNCSYTFCRYSSIADAVKNISGAGQWVIYPNPFSDWLSIQEKSGGDRVESIAIYDVQGRMILNKNTGDVSTNSLWVNLSGFPEGMYFLKIKTNKTDYTLKIIK